MNQFTSLQQVFVPLFRSISRLNLHTNLKFGDGVLGTLDTKLHTASDVIWAIVS